MSSPSKLKRKPAASALATKPRVAAPPLAGGKQTSSKQEEIRNLILAMSIELSELAYKNDLNAVAVALDMVREVVIAERSASDQHLQRS